MFGDVELRESIISIYHILCATHKITFEWKTEENKVSGTVQLNSTFSYTSNFYDIPSLPEKEKNHILVAGMLAHDHFIPVIEEICKAHGLGEIYTEQIRRYRRYLSLFSASIFFPPDARAIIN